MQPLTSIVQITDICSTLLLKKKERKLFIKFKFLFYFPKVYELCKVLAFFGCVGICFRCRCLLNIFLIWILFFTMSGESNICKSLVKYDRMKQLIKIFEESSFKLFYWSVEKLRRALNLFCFFIIRGQYFHFSNLW